MRQETNKDFKTGDIDLFMNFPFAPTNYVPIEDNFKIKQETNNFF
jgi:hypothetical protein